MKPIQVKVRDAENIIFEGETDRISSFNEVGRFDVFPMHANFISIINQELTIFNKNQKVKEVKVEQAILKIKQDVATVFLGIESLIIDEEKAVEKVEKNALKDGQ
ncbi:MAG TPA: hypothetical protein VEW42_05665 [Candidatus Eisenbacteria bacterium]|nr:hypothetical protein [Candidatus Eisenbacteria bacterium]